MTKNQQHTNHNTLENSNQTTNKNNNYIPAGPTSNKSGVQGCGV